jgi:Tol biopolymer transport system component
MTTTHRMTGLSVLCASALAAGSMGQTIRLSGDMVQPVGGEIATGFLVSPDGQRVVYCADQDTDEVIELYSVPVDGSSAPVKLNGPLVPGGDVSWSELTITADSRRVLYMAQQEAWLYNAYSVPIDGSEGPVALTLPGADPGGPRSFCRATPDGTRVVYCRDQSALYGAAIDGSGSAVLLSGSSTIVSQDFVFVAGERVVYTADRDAPSTFQLYSTPVDGNGTTQRLSGPLAPGGDVQSFALTPDGSHVVYVADQDSDDVFELFVVPADGSSAPRKLSGSLLPGGDVDRLEISSDSRRVVYSADAMMDDVVECFSVPIDGGGRPIRLNQRMVAGGDVTAISITPDARSVIYVADQEKDDTRELYRVPIDGRRSASSDGAPPGKLNAPLVAGGEVVGFRIASDGTVAYRADQDADGVFEVYAVAARGSRSARKLNSPLVPGGQVTRHEFVPDGSRVLYLADQETDRMDELYSAPADASAVAVRLNAELPRGGDVRWFISAGAHVVFDAPRDTDTINAGTGLQVVPAIGGIPAIVTPELALGPVAGDVHQSTVSPDGLWVAYIADQEEDQVDEIYAVRTDGSSTPVKLNAWLVEGGDVRISSPDELYEFTPDSMRVLFCADQELDERVELYAARIDGSAPPVRLSPDLGPEEDVLGGPRVSPDGQRAVFRVRRAQVIELWSAAIEGAPSPVLLHSDDLWDGDVRSFEIDASGTRVVYLAGGLWSRWIDGRGEPIRLTTAPYWSSVSSFALDSLGTRAVFLGDQLTNDVVELYCVPIDGSVAAIRLCDPLSADRDVSSFSISPDGTRVAYLSDQGFNERWELFSVPIDRGQVPVRLNDPLVGAGHVGYPGRQTYVIDSQSRRVVYLAESASTYELFSVPLDGSAHAIKLSGTLVAGGDVGANPAFFALTPDARTVVYVADQEIDQEVELYAAPIDGSRAAFKLSRRVPGEIVRRFSIDPHGLRALYSTGPPLSGHGHLFEVPLARGAVPREVQGNDQYDFTPDARWIVHRSALREPNVIELYATRLTPPKTVRAATPEWR